MTPITDIVYLDNNSTTRPDPAVVEAMLPFMRELYGNPSSVHTFGAQLGNILEQARETIASLIGGRGSEIAFTSGGTESDNWALAGSVMSRRGRNRVVISAVEHAAVLEMAEALEKRTTPEGEPIEVVRVPVDIDGRLNMNALADVLGGEDASRIAVISIMHANNETGVIMHVPAVARAIADSGCRAWLHVDATQTFGKIPLNAGPVDEGGLGCDLLTASAHKIHGPKGVGLLWIRRGVRLRPWMIGGPQEREKRAGTENVAGIVGFSKAVELAAERMQRDAEEVGRLRDRLEREVREAIPDVRVNGGESPRLHNTANLAFAGVEAEPILMLLSEAGIAASAGSACSSGSLEASHVIHAMGVEETYAHGSIRFSLSRETTDADIDRLLAVLPGVIERLRKLNVVG